MGKTVIARCKMHQIDQMLKGVGLEEWGAEACKDYFVIKFSQQIA